jgi:recombination protein RecA
MIDLTSTLKLEGAVAYLLGPDTEKSLEAAMAVLAKAQQKGGVVAIITNEKPGETLDVTGIDIESTLISETDSKEEAEHVLELLLSSNAVDAIIVDSFALDYEKASKYLDLAKKSKSVVLSVIHDKHSNLSIEW